MMCMKCKMPDAKQVLYLVGWMSLVSQVITAFTLLSMVLNRNPIYFRLDKFGSSIYNRIRGSTKTIFCIESSCPRCDANDLTYWKCAI